MAWEGNLTITSNIDSITDYNSYNQNVSGSVPYLGNGKYSLINKIPVLTPSTDPADISDHSPSNLTSFYICKSHDAIQQNWNKQSIDPLLDSLPYIWGKKYRVQQNTEYEVSFFYVNANKTAATNNNSILVRVNYKDIIEKEVEFDLNYEWKKVSFIWNSGNEEYLDLGIFNIEKDVNNYVAFDDLSIKRICGCSGGILSRNFNFDEGNVNVGANVDIRYSNPGGTTTGALGLYTVGENLVWLNASGQIGEHTYNGLGKIAYYKLRDNGVNGNVAYKIWNQKIDVVRNKDYEFNFWWTMPDAQNVLYGNHKAIINIKVNNVIVQSLETGNNASIWNALKGKWNSGENTLADIQIEVIIDRGVFNGDFEIALDDVVFKENCNAEICETKPPYLPVVERNLEEECISYMNLIKDHNAKIAFENYINSVKKEFRESYIAKCLSVQENFLMKMENNEYHTTLYYYDQGGNLVRTVPPQGVDPLTGTEINAVKSELAAGSRETYNSHTFVTTYKYNSLNQLVAQSTPDNEDFNVFDGVSANLYPLANNETIHSLCYLDKYRGIVVGENTTLNSGFIKFGDPIKNTWTNNTSPIDYGDFVNVHVVSSTEVYASTKDGAIVYSTDGGTLWYSKNAPTENPIIYLRKSGTSSMIVFNESGDFWNSTDLGTTWGPKQQITSTPIQVKSVSNDGNSFVVLANDGSRYYCNNVTATSPAWNKHKGLKAENLRLIVKGKDINKWFAFGDKGFMLSSDDAGNNWNWVPSNLTHDIKKAYVWNDTKAVFLTTNNQVFYTHYNSTGLIDLTEFSTGNALVDLAVHGNFVYILEDIGNIYIKNMFGGSAWNSTIGILPIEHSDYNRISVLDENTIFTSRINNNIDLQIMRSQKSTGVWTTYQVNMGAVSTNHTIWDIHPYTNTKIEVILNDGTTTYLYEIKDINTSTNNSTITSITTGNFVPRRFEVNHNSTPFLIGQNGTIVKVFEKNTQSLWNAFEYSLPLTSNQFSSIWMENSNPNAKGICVGVNGEIHSTLFKWKPNTLNAFTTFDRSSKIKEPTLNSVFHNGNEIVAVGNKGAIIYTPVTSGIPASNWNLLQHVNLKGNLYDVTGNKNGNLVAVGESGSIIHVNKVSSQMVASSITNFSIDLSYKNFRKVNIHNYVINNSNLGIFLIDHENQIYNLGFSISTNSYNSGSYSTVNSPSITNTLNSIGSFGTTAFIVGNKNSGVGQTHQIIKFNHTSGSISAIPISINNVNALLKVCAVPNSNSAVAVGKSGYLIISNDRGISWKNKFTGISSDLTSVNFIDAKNGIAVGKNKAAVYTTDGGKTWQSQSISGANFDFVDVGMGATNRILALIKYETPSPHVSNILQNLGGLSSSTWTAVSGSPPLSGLYNAISFPGPKYAFVAGNNNLILRLSYTGSGYQASVLQNNSAQNWSTALSSSNSNLYSIYFRDYENGFVGGDNGFLMRTRNGGASSPVFEWSPSYCAKKIKVMNGCQNENLHLVQYGSSASDTVICLKNFEFSTKFYYDGLGRMVASQNTKQMREGKTVYSYTLYDYKGRIVEVGKKVANNTIENAVASINSVSGPVYDLGMVDYNRFEAWILADISTFPRKEVTRTYYDNFRYTVSINGRQFTQDNLRGRVVSSTHTDILTANDVDNNATNDTYLSASHYSYDIHGNVKSLAQENKLLSTNNSDLVAKRIDYEYDLISGKVNKVTYQKAMSDQFIHKYAYDADNRIIEVETSHDGVIWQKDAKYLYYRHGPLARVELGTQQVQGVDYAYTIQGWLKGVNSTNLKGENDIGKDAYASSANSNTYFAKDEFGFSLNYFDGDYAATKIPNSTSNYFLGETNGSGLNASTNNLFNGNIKSMVTTLAKFTSSNVPVANGMAYQYDQLNRIISATNNTNFDANTNIWKGGGTGAAYESNFTYDANGNILSLNRKDEAGTLYDDFTYTYSNLGTGNIKNTNRLTQVSDAVSTSAYVGDIENGQISNNYQYDANGNLIADAQEEIQSIEWNLYGKIKSITRTTSSTKPGLEFLYDPTGNRIAKIVKPAGGSNNDWHYTLYFRDAQGNILSTYEYQNSNASQLNTYIYGSSRIGEFNPNGFIECGVNFVVSEVNTKEELKAWFQDYLQNVLGCNSDFSTAMHDYIDSELESDIGITIDQLALTGDQNYKRFLMNLVALFCRIRLFHDLSNQDFNNSVKPKIREWFSYAYSQTQAWTSFSESIWLDIENNRKQVGTDLYVNCLSGGAFVYDDGTQFYGLGSRKYELSNHLGNVLAVITDKKIPKGQNGNFSDLILLSSQFLTGTEDWEAINGSTLETTNDKLTISGTNPDIGAVTSLSLKENTNYTLNFELTYSSSPSDIMVTLKDQNQATIYTGYANNAAGINNFAMGLGTFTNPVTLEITNSSNNQTFELDNITLTQDGIAGVSYYTAQLVSAQDYYPFGTTLPGRTFQDDRFSGYRFSFNGKEKDKEGMGGGGSTYDYGFRIYNPNLGKFLSVDPLTASYPWYTPYQFAGNMPITAIDLDGLEEVIINEYQMFGVTYLKTYNYVEAERRTINQQSTYVQIIRNGNVDKRNAWENGKKTNWGGAQVKDISEINNARERKNVQGLAENDGGAGASWVAPDKASLKFSTNANSVEDAKKSLSSETQSTLQQYAVLLLQVDKLGINVEGFASESGNNEQNKNLSANRANAAKQYIIDYLKSNNVDIAKINSVSSRIHTSGKGAVKDGTGNNADNRRADITLTNSDGSNLTQEQGKGIASQYRSNP